MSESISVFHSPTAFEPSFLFSCYISIHINNISLPEGCKILTIFTAIPPGISRGSSWTVAKQALYAPPLPLTSPGFPHWLPGADSVMLGKHNSANMFMNSLIFHLTEHPKSVMGGSLQMCLQRRLCSRTQAMKEQHHHHIQEIVITDDVGKL